MKNILIYFVLFAMFVSLTSMSFAATNAHEGIQKSEVLVDVNSEDEIQKNTDDDNSKKPENSVTESEKDEKKVNKNTEIKNDTDIEKIKNPNAKKVLYSIRKPTQETFHADLDTVLTSDSDEEYEQVYIKDDYFNRVIDPDKEEEYIKKKRKTFEFLSDQLYCKVSWWDCMWNNKPLGDFPLDLLAWDIPRTYSVKPCLPTDKIAKRGNRIYEIIHGKGGSIDMREEVDIQGPCYHLKFNDNSINAYKDYITLSDPHREGLKERLKTTGEIDRKMLKNLEEIIMNAPGKKVSGKVIQKLLEERGRLLNIIQLKERMEDMIEKHQNSLSLFSQEFINFLQNIETQVNNEHPFVSSRVGMLKKDARDFVWDHLANKLRILKVMSYSHGKRKSNAQAIVPISPEGEGERYRTRETLVKIFHDFNAMNGSLPKLHIDKDLAVGDHFIQYEICEEKSWQNARRNLEKINTLRVVPPIQS